MRIAIVGTGIAGMAAARLLAEKHDVTVYEAGDYVGGHTRTVPVERGGRTFAVDTGFIVYNEATYPNFCRLLDRIGVATKPTSMSFSVRIDATGLEYASQSIDAVFAQRANALRPSFLAMLRAIPRFNADAHAFIAGGDETTTMAQFFARHRYPAMLADAYLVPMLAAIWSADPQRVMNLPARHFFRFFANHGLLTLGKRPQWRVLEGGSSSYVAPLTKPYRHAIRLNAPVHAVRRRPHGVEIESRGQTDVYDEAVIAAHSDQALAMLADPSEAEREILGAIPYQPNDVILHTDAAALPANRRAWASWNYRIPSAPNSLPTLTYNMNILQGIDSPETFCVTLNQTASIDPARIVRRFRYSHPVYSAEAIAAQARYHEIGGVNRTHYCGAYWGYGFHEDGLNSAIRAAEALGAGFP